MRNTRNGWKRGARLAAAAACATLVLGACGVTAAGRSPTRPRRTSRRPPRPATAATVNMAVNPWVGYEADAYVVGARRRDRARLHGQLQGARRRTSPGRASAPARSTSSWRTGATPTWRRSSSPTSGDGSAETSARPATTASSAGTSRRGSRRSTRTSSTTTTSTSTPKDFATSESGGKGQFLGADPSYVPVRRGDRQQPRPRLQGRLLRQRGAPASRPSSRRRRTRSS